MGRLSKQLAKAAAVLRTPKQATKQVRGIVHAGKLSISSPVHLKGTKSPLYDRLNTILRSEPEEDDEDERKQYLLSPVYDQIKSPPDGTTANSVPKIRPSRAAPAPPPRSASKNPKLQPIAVRRNTAATSPSSSSPSPSAAANLSQKPTHPPPRNSGTTSALTECKYGLNSDIKYTEEEEEAGKEANHERATVENHYDKLTLTRQKPKHVPNPLYESSGTLGSNKSIEHPKKTETEKVASAAASAAPALAEAVGSVMKRRKRSEDDGPAASGGGVQARPPRPDNSVIFKIAERGSGEYLQLVSAASEEQPHCQASGERPVPPERPQRPTSDEMDAAALKAPPTSWKRPLSNGSIGETVTDDVGGISTAADIESHPQPPPRRKRKKTAAAAAAAAKGGGNGGSDATDFSATAGPSFPLPQPPKA